MLYEGMAAGMKEKTRTFSTKAKKMRLQFLYSLAAGQSGQECNLISNHGYRVK